MAGYTDATATVELRVDLGGVRGVSTASATFPFYTEGSKGIGSLLRLTQLV